jgi:hypothetical protein
MISTVLYILGSASLTAAIVIQARRKLYQRDDGFRYLILGLALLAVAVVFV